MPTIDLKVLDKLGQQGLPPVHTWSPPFCGDMDMLIKANGDWIHQGGKINRPAMVTLFSRILWFEGGQYFLVTPVEKVRIAVEDAPFLVTAWQWLDTEQGRAVEFATLTGDVMILGLNCDIWLAPFTDEQRPYISMRYGMKALISRAVFYDLADNLIRVDTAKASGLGLISAGKSYLLMQDE